MGTKREVYLGGRWIEAPDGLGSQPTGPVNTGDGEVFVRQPQNKIEEEHEPAKLTKKRSVVVTG